MLKELNVNKFKYVLIWTFIFGIVAHGFRYFNLMYTHDAIASFPQAGDINHQIQIGRFMHAAYIKVRGSYYVPSFVGILCLVFIAISAYLLLEIFSIKNKFEIVVTIGLLTTNVTIISLNASFIHDADIYGLAFLLTTIASYLYLKSQKSFIACSIILAISMGLYQGFIAVAIVVFMIVSIQELINNKDLLIVIKNGILFIAMILFSLTLYYMLVIFSQSITGIVGVSYYNSASNALKFNSFWQMVKCFKSSYYNYFTYYINPKTYHTQAVMIANLVLLIALIYFLVGEFKKTSFKSVVLIVVLICLIPFGTNIVYFISSGATDSDLIMYATQLSYLFVLVIINEVQCFGIEKIKRIILLMMCFVIYENCIFANAVYLRKQLEINNTMMTINRIVAKLECLDDFRPWESKLIIKGNLNAGEISKRRTVIGSEVTGVDGENYSLTYFGTYKHYFNEIISYPIEIINGDNLEDRQLIEVIEQMPAYPSNDSIAVQGEYIIVKLS